VECIHVSFQQWRFFLTQQEALGLRWLLAIFDVISDYELVSKLIISLLNVQRNIDVRRAAAVCRYYSGRERGAPRPPTDRQQHNFCTAGASQRAHTACSLPWALLPSAQYTQHTYHISNCTKSITKIINWRIESPETRRRVHRRVGGAGCVHLEELSSLLVLPELN
jgi:hypothetical protein